MKVDPGPLARTSPHAFPSHQIVVLGENKYTLSLTYEDSAYDFATLQRCESNTNSVETELHVLNFDLFLC